MKTLVTFRSHAFNVSGQEGIKHNHLSGLGGDLAAWLIDRLRQMGMRASSEPVREDYGWYFTFAADGVEHDFVVGYRPPDEGEPGVWIGWVERKCGFLASLLGGRDRDIRPAAVTAINSILTGSRDILDIRWHHRDKFDRGEEDHGSSDPMAG